MNGIKDNKRNLFLLVMSIMFLIKDFTWFAYIAIVLFCVVLIGSRRIDLDIGDLILFYSSYRYVVSRVSDAPWALVRGMAFVAIYQLGKKATDKDNSISPICVIAPALAFLIKGILDYSALFRTGTSETVLFWPDWSGNLLNRSEHEYYLVLMASLLIYFVYFSVKVSRVGIAGIILSLGAVVLALYAKGRLAFWACLFATVVAGVGMVVEKKLYKMKAFRMAGASVLALMIVVIILFGTNTFGLYDSYKDSVWSEEGGPIYNSRFDMMGQQIMLFYDSYSDRTGELEDDPALINSDGEELYYVSNSWLQIGRKKGVPNMLWTVVFSVYSIICLIISWMKSKDMNKYVVISAFVGITFLNMIEPAITTNAVFWALEVYLAGMSRAIYTRACSPQKWDAGISFSYV